MWWTLADNFAVVVAVVMLVGLLAAVFLPDGAKLVRYLRNFGGLTLAVLALCAAAVTAPLWLGWLAWNWWRQLHEAEKLERAERGKRAFSAMRHGATRVLSGEYVGDDSDYRLLTSEHVIPDDPA